MSDTSIFERMANTKLAQIAHQMPDPLSTAGPTPGNSLSKGMPTKPKVPKAPKAPLLNANSRVAPVLNSTTRKNLGTPTGQLGPAMSKMSSLRSLALTHYSESGAPQLGKLAAIMAPPQPPVPPTPFAQKASGAPAGNAPAGAPPAAQINAQGAPPQKKAMPGATDQSMLKQNPGPGLARMPGAGNPAATKQATMIKQSAFKGSFGTQQGARPVLNPKLPTVPGAAGLRNVPEVAARGADGKPMNPLQQREALRPAWSVNKNQMAEAARKRASKSGVAGTPMLDPIDFIPGAAIAHMGSLVGKHVIGAPAAAAGKAAMNLAGRVGGGGLAARVLAAAGLRGAGASLGTGRAAGATAAHVGSGLLAGGAAAVGAGLSRVGQAGGRAAASHAGIAAKPLEHVGEHLAKHEGATLMAKYDRQGATAPTANPAVRATRGGGVGALAGSTGSFVSGATGGPPRTPGSMSASGAAPKTVRPPAAPTMSTMPKKPANMTMAAPFMNKTSSAWDRMLENKVALSKHAQASDPFAMAGGKLDAKGNQDYSTIPTNRLTQVGGNQPKWYGRARQKADAAANSGVGGFVNRGLAGTAALASKGLNYRLPGGDTPGKLLGATIGMPGVPGVGAAARFLASRVAVPVRAAVYAGKYAVPHAPRLGLQAQLATSGGRAVTKAVPKLPAGAQLASQTRAVRPGGPPRAVLPGGPPTAAAPTPVPQPGVGEHLGKAWDTFKMPKVIDDAAGKLAKGGKEVATRPDNWMDNYRLARGLPDGVLMPKWTSETLPKSTLRRLWSNSGASWGRAANTNNLTSVTPRPLKLLWHAAKRGLQTGGATGTVGGAYNALLGKRDSGKNADGLGMQALTRGLEGSYVGSGLSTATRVGNTVGEGVRSLYNKARPTAASSAKPNPTAPVDTKRNPKVQLRYVKDGPKGYE